MASKHQAITSWNSVRLSELTIANVTYGVVQPGIDSPNGVPMVRVNNFSGHTLGLSNVMRINPGIESKYKRTRLQSGDVLVTVVGSVGQVAIVPSALAGWNIARAVALIRPNHPDLSRWIAFVLRSPSAQHQLGITANTTVQTTINLKDLKALSIPLPSRSTRAAICEVLGALDDRIELLRETNTTLEAIAQSLFQSWFVDFDPVRAKAEGLTPAGMDADTAVLFPSEFEESELGLIPKGWRAGTLGDISTLNAESWSAKRSPDRIAYVDLSSVEKNQFSELVEHDFSGAPSRARRILRDGDSIVGMVRPGNRAFAYIHQPPANLTGSTGFAVLSPHDKVASGFIYLAATRNASIERLANLADGGAYPAVRPDVVSATPIIIPSDGALAAFGAIANPLLEKIAENGETARSLGELRDTLLPRLISGKLRLPENEVAHEEAMS